MNILNNRYFKTIAPAVISAITGLSGNALFSLEVGSGGFFASIFIFVITLLADIILIIYYVSQKESDNKLVCESDDEIKEAMKKIIKMQGKICVMSRDLSWVDCEVEACILSKAPSVLIFAEKETSLTQKLQEKGVDIRYYGDLNFEPKTRFTVIRYNTNSPQVAIANTQNSIRKKGKIRHTIYQTQKNNGTDEWINSLAIDMIQLCKSVCKGKTDE